MDKQEILINCTIDGNIVKLPPGQLDRKLYVEIAKSLELIGGKWKGGKIMGFVFEESPTELLAQIAKGSEINIKKEYQFFPTPAHLADRMVKLAEIDQYDLILEPSAGQGAIVNAIHKQTDILVHYCELMKLNRSYLNKIKNTTYLKDNFLLMNTPNLFHKIIANPPFSKNQDIQHIMHMWDCLAPGGRIVAISSRHWEYSDNKKESTFRDFLKKNNAYKETLPKDTFKESGTSIETNLLVIDKK